MLKLTAALTALLLGAAYAHETKLVDNGQYKVIVGMVKEPAYSMERNGLDLIVRTGDDQPVPDLEKSLKAELMTQDGSQKRPLNLRAQYGKPGYYTDDFVLANPGIYKVHVFGYIGDAPVDETYETSPVGDMNTLIFPAPK